MRCEEEDSTYLKLNLVAYILLKRKCWKMTFLCQNFFNRDGTHCKTHTLCLCIMKSNSLLLPSHPYSYSGGNYWYQSLVYTSTCFYKHIYCYSFSFHTNTTLYTKDLTFCNCHFKITTWKYFYVSMSRATTSFSNSVIISYCINRPKLFSHSPL